jgi:hypothetical protein
MKNTKSAGFFLSFLIVSGMLLGCSKGNKAVMNFQRDTQAPVVQITDPENNSTLSGTVSIQISAVDNIGVKSVDLLLNGVVAASDNAAPWEFSWDTSTSDDGVYSIAAKAYDAAGNGSEFYTISVSVVNKIDITFVNHAFTTLSLSVDQSNLSAEISAGASRTWTYDRNPGTITYHASTSGETSSGNPIGLEISWNFSDDVAGYQTFTINLNVSSDIFFLYMINNGTTTLTPLYVNYGTTEQTQDNILIPADGAKYRTGYYKAFSNTEVRMYKQNNPSSCIYWQQGVHFTLPFTENQSVTLQNSYALLGQGNAESEALTKGSPELPPQAEIRISEIARTSGKVLNHTNNFIRQ